MTKTSKTSKFVAGVLGVAMTLSLVGGIAPSANAQSVDLSAQIAALQAQLAALLAQAGQTTGGTSTGYTFSTDLSEGMTHADVVNLQKVLNSNVDTRVSTSGAGSPGMESNYFGAKTKAAVIKFQAKYGISAIGRVGPATRAKLNSMSGSVVTNPGTNPGTVTPVGGGLAVSAASQPANSLAPTSAARIPFTKVTLSAGSSDVTVNSITVERSGLGEDSVFAGIVLLDENGTQIGTAKTLNSNHQANVGEPFVVRANTSKTVTVAGNMSSSLSTKAGQVVGLNVVAVNTGATVTGSLPVGGAMHTINATLSLGSATLAVSSFDPNTSATKEIGTTGYKFAGVRVTAGSSEKVRLWSIRFNQTGSASANDLANVVVNVDGTNYPATVSADGKYFTASFGSGIVVDKGFSKDVYIQGDVVGSGASGRTVKFDLYKNTDIYMTGESFGYGITGTAGTTGSASNSTSEFTTGTPFFDGSLLTISAGSATTIGKANTVPAQNIAINVPNQPLGGFTTNFRGEPIAVQQMVFTVASSSGSGTGTLTSVTLVDQNGAVVAGPVDAVYASATTQTVTFTDTVTFPIGARTYTLKGTVPSSIGNGTVYTVTTAPASQWSNITGQTSGNTISLSSISSFSMNAMTVKAGSLAITVSADPASTNIVAGSSGVTFAKYQFDASASGEDVRFSSIPLQLTYGGFSATGNLSNCQLFDAGTALNNTSVVNTSAHSASTSAQSSTFTFDQTLVVPKGTVKVVDLKCDVSPSTLSGSTFRWGVAASPSVTVTGVTSSNEITETVTANAGSTMTISTGSLVAAKDASAPSYRVTAAGATDVTTGVLRIRPTNEGVNVEKIGLKLTNTASSSAQNLTRVTLWQGATKVGSAVFTGANTTATSTLDTIVSAPKDQDTLITIKSDLAAINQATDSTTGPGTEGALITVDVDSVRGTGVQSGSTIDSTGTASFDGIRVFKSYPTFAQDSLSATGVADTKLMRFKVTASPSGSISIAKFSFTISTTSGVGVSTINLFGYEDASYSQAISGVSSAGQIAATNLSPAANITSAQQDIYVETSAGASTTLVIPAGVTRYFELRASSITGLTTGSSVTTTLLGDTQYPILAGLMGTVTTVNANATGFNNFIWSPNATTTSGLTSHTDWTNGYNVPGLPSSGITQSRSI